MYISDLDDMTDFEFCEFHKNTKTWIFDSETFFFQRKNSFITHLGLLFIKE